MIQEPPGKEQLVHEQYICDGSYGLVYLTNDGYELWEIPQYGGYERLYNLYPTLAEAIKGIDNLK